jgi:Putative beta-lactamase-inhibitor-like, PepSY-like
MIDKPYKFTVMKIPENIFAILTMLVLTNIACSQESRDAKNKTPMAVRESFQAKYPGEYDPDWHQDSHGNYEASFKKNGEKYRADFAENGDWMETENSIKKKNLSKHIKEVIRNKFPTYEISEVERVDHATKGIFYDVEFKQKGKNKDVEFAEDGTILN